MSDGNSNPTEQRPQQPGQPLIEPEGLEPLYANFCRVSSTPEELVLDLGLNPQPFGGSTAPVKVTQRLVVNFFTAKRMWMALGVALQRHEQAFGPIEVDVNKRTVAQQPKK
jgi:hypothetical protein